MKDEALKARAQKVIGILAKTYPGAKIALKYKTPFQLLVVTVLSAQSTDRQVNKISPELFKAYKTVKDFAEADLNDLEKYVHSTGFFHAKARNLKMMAQEILKRFKGTVPRTMEELVTLPGVARKTSNVVLFNAFGINDGIAVDTHVKRVSQRLGLTKNEDPNKIEKDLMGLFSKRLWGKINHYFIAHGRNICDAKRPKCEICPIKSLCDYYNKGLN